MPNQEFPQAWLSDHAKQRLRERSVLSESDLLRLLDQNLMYSVGMERGTSRLHRLYFSQADKRHFVCIQDIHNGELITILPISYHQRFAWKIDDRVFDSTMKLAVKPAVPGKKAQVIKLSVICEDSEGYRRIISLGSLPISGRLNEKDLKDDPLIVTTAIIRAEPTVQGYRVYAYIARIGKLGAPIVLDPEIIRISIIGLAEKVS